ncbi:MAG TPA: agmatine deiminase family protein [Gammaproteobacteria bacterium]|nr:agmatine deiminase family protein [Gammaproteobacteria bacterium]
MSTDDSILSQGTWMPPEWSPHRATWLSWPHNAETWPGTLSTAEAAMIEVAAALAPHEHVHINVLDSDHRSHVLRQLSSRVPPERVTYHAIATDDAWIRDHGAIFVFAPDSMLHALDFDYNAWGGKYPPWDHDRQVAARMAEVLGVGTSRPGIVLEGGSIDVNGAGVVLTTEQCLLNANRNPSLSRAQIESQLRRHLGVRQVVWLGQGIEGDDTDGHIDDLTRFVGEHTLVTVLEDDRGDVNHAPLAENRRRLEQLSIDGRSPEVHELPMPTPLYANGQRLPASYANFYIANGVVLLPVFDCRADAQAAEVLQACLPGREVARIDARALVHGLGGIHCLTQQVPADDALLSCPRVFPKVTGPAPQT